MLPVFCPRSKKISRLGDGLGDGLGDSTQAHIIDLVQASPTISITEMSRALKISTTAVEKAIKRMKLKGILKRVGPVKGGYWKASNVSNRS
jgi:ATP-dependent DNA helicase RecG